MKTLILLFVLTLAAQARNATDDLIDFGGPVADELKRQALYPPLPFELPTETQARVALLEMMDKLKAAGKLTPELELSINKAVAEILAAEAARIQKDRERREPVHVIVDN